ASSGDLTSSILDITDETEWGWIQWSSDTPDGTSLVVELRASDDSDSMGSWSEVSWGADLGDEYPSMQGYLQYRVFLSTTDPLVSPTFSSVDFYPYFHLVSPSDGSVVKTLTPTLDWDDTVLPGFDTYTLWWGTDPDFGDYNEVSSIVDSTYRITSGIEDGDVIYWRVKAVDSSSNEFWAPERDWSFTVDLDFDLELVCLGARVEDDGVLLSWLFAGEVPASVRVLREVEDSITPLHAVPLSGDSRRYLDRDVSPDVEYSYWLEVTTSEGVVSRFGPTEAVRIEPERLVLWLSDPYPSPAGERVAFAFSLPSDSRVELSVYDLAGRHVATLVSGEFTAGRHEVSWDSSTVPSGVYLLRLSAPSGVMAGRVVVAR
ncbi:T9SS type A sorting domain-containing protein, partial [bacterium]|nr:T9SS type A sorting domain-containing protein [bacterium]